MKAVNLIFATILLLSGANSYAQALNSLSFSAVLIDSIALKTGDFSDRYNFPIIKADEKHIYYAGGDSLVVSVFDFTGKVVNKLPGNSKTYNLKHAHNALIPNKDGSAWFGIGQKNFVRLSPDGRPADTLRFSARYNNRYYYLNVGERVTGFDYNSADSTFLLPVLYSSKSLGHLKSSQHYRNNNKLLAVCIVQGKKLEIQRFIGDRDSIYYENLYPHLNHFQFQLNQTNLQQVRLYITQQVSPTITVYKTSGELLQTFGEMAQHPGINPKAIPHKFRLNLDKGGYYDMKYYIESPVYTFIHHENNLTLRGYRAAVKDPTKYKKYKDTVVGCNIISQSPIDIAQHAAIKAKPYGLQIYNAKDKLVYDEIMPRPFRSVLHMEGNVIWADGKPDPKNNLYWIYKYQISSDETLGVAKP